MGSRVTHSIEDAIDSGDRRAGTGRSRATDRYEPRAEPWGSHEPTLRPPSRTAHPDGATRGPACRRDVGLARSVPCSKGIVEARYPNNPPCQPVPQGGRPIATTCLRNYPLGRNVGRQWKHPSVVGALVQTFSGHVVGTDFGVSEVPDAKSVSTWTSSVVGTGVDLVTSRLSGTRESRSPEVACDFCDL
jgi:hypothetical protein